jgi:hypothetical protein
VEETTTIIEDAKSASGVEGVNQSFLEACNGNRSIAVSGEF